MRLPHNVFSAKRLRSCLSPSPISLLLLFISASLLYLPHRMAILADSILTAETDDKERDVSYSLPPHGGLTEPVCRTVPAGEIAAFRARAATLPQVPVSDADLSTVYRFGDGGLSPLTGPMDKADLRPGARRSGHRPQRQAYAWTIPLSLPVTAELAKTLGPGKEVALVNSAGEIVATLESTTSSPGTRCGTSRASTRPSGPITPAATWCSRATPQDASGRRHDSRAAAAQAPAVRQVRPHAARGPQAVRREGLGARRRLPDAQPAAPGPRVRAGLRPGDAAAAGPQRRGVLNPLIGETKGDDVDADVAHAHLRGADREPLARRGRQGRGPLGPARRSHARPRDPPGPGHQDVLRRAERGDHARHLPPELRLHRHHHRPQARRRPVPRRQGDLGRFRRPGDLRPTSRASCRSSR